MKPLHLMMALLVVLIWGFNFVVIKIGLTELPPILLGVFRFALAAVPAVFFVKRPQVPFSMVVLYGLLMFALQFALLFGGMSLGVSAGLSSLALQLQVFVTIALAVLFLGERPSLYQLAGAVIALGGMGVLALNTGGDVTAIGLFCVILAACSWGSANIVSRKIGRVDMLSLIVWGSLVAPVPLLVLSLVVEGPTRIVQSLAHMSWVSVLSIAYIVYPTTLLGFSIWSWLLSRYPVAAVAPVTLLVPVVGIASSVVVLGEPLQSWKILAALLVLLGLAVNMFGNRLQALWTGRQTGA